MKNKTLAGLEKTLLSVAGLGFIGGIFAAPTLYLTGRIDAQELAFYLSHANLFGVSALLAASALGCNQITRKYGEINKELENMNNNLREFNAGGF